MTSSLRDFVLDLNMLLVKSEQATRQTIDSIRGLESSISTAHSRLAAELSTIEKQKMQIRNLHKLIEHLEQFTGLINSIDSDRLKILAGPLGSFSVYIEKLHYVKEMTSKYEWLNESNALNNYNFFKISLMRSQNLIRKGEQIIAQEFNDVVKHYSNFDTIPQFVEYLNCGSNDCFIPNETISKLEQICCWFLQQEKQYELYNEQAEHCDINQKLNFSQIRNPYLKLAMDTFTASRSNCANAITPADYIEIFTQILSFCLKLLTHENVLLTRIYSKSNETRIDLISKLTILVFELIEFEFEQFFTNAFDFSKLINNGDDVVDGIVQLILTVKSLKETATCLQTEDLSSASKLLQFSIRLNQLGGIILATYIDVIRTGSFNYFAVPVNCSLHEYCKKTFSILSLLNKHETSLSDSIEYANQVHKFNLIEQDFADENSTSNIYLASYVLHVIEHLINFLNEESCKIEYDAQIRFVKKNEVKHAIKNFKISIFLFNNLDGVKTLLSNLVVDEETRLIIEMNLEKSLRLNLEKACEIFRIIKLKWQHLNKESITNDVFKSHLYFKEYENKANNFTHLNFLKMFSDSKKKKKKEDVVLIIKEIVVLSSTLVYAPAIREHIRSEAVTILRPIIEVLEKEGLLEDIFKQFEMHLDNKEDLIEKIFLNMF